MFKTRRNRRREVISQLVKDSMGEEYNFLMELEEAKKSFRKKVSNVTKNIKIITKVFN